MTINVSAKANRGVGNDVWSDGSLYGGQDVYAYSVVSGNDVFAFRQRYDRSETVAAGFPTQFAGLRVFYNAVMKELCLVADADAPLGMGGVIRVLKGAVNYAVYLVETTDPLATPVRVRTSTGIKAVRIKT